MSVTITPTGTRGRKFPTINALYTAAMRLNTWVYRLLRGRGMESMALLTTVGAKSGQRRTLPLAVFEAGVDTWWIVASKGGAPQHPAWYHNLAKNPGQVELEVGGRKLAVAPESLHGAEREEAWETITRLAPNFGGYAKSTDREIPVVKLTAA